MLFRSDGDVIVVKEITLRNQTDFKILQGFLVRSSGSTVWVIPEIPPGGEVKIEAPIPEVDLRTVGSDARDAPSDGLGGDSYLRNVLQALRSRPSSSSADTFIGLIEREEADFQVDQASTLERRLDVLVEYL